MGGDKGLVSTSKILRRTLLDPAEKWKDALDATAEGEWKYYLVIYVTISLLVALERPIAIEAANNSFFHLLFVLIMFQRCLMNEKHGFYFPKVEHLCSCVNVSTFIGCTTE